MAAFVGIKGRNADEAMHAPFGPATTVSMLARDEQGHTLDPGGFARKRVGDFHFPAAAFGPALVHAHEHIGPIASLGAASAGVDAENAVVFIVRAVKEYFEFVAVQFFEEFGEVAFEV